MSGRTSTWCLASIVPIVAIHVLFPESAGLVLLIVTALGAAAAMAWAGWRRRGRPVRGIALLAIALLVNAIAETIATTWPWLTGGSEPPYPGPADLFYLAFYPLTAAGLAWFVRRRSRGRDRSAVIDAAIVTLGAGVVLWQFVVLPLRAENDVNTIAGLVSVAYPSGDLLLLAYTLRLALSSGRRPQALKLLIAGLVMLFAADMAFLWSETTDSYFVGAPLDVLYDVAYLLFAAAALHPSFAELLEPSEAGKASLRWGRLGMLTAATLLAPAVAISTGVTAVLVPVGASAVMFVLVMSRVAGLMVDVERSGARRFRSLVQHSTDFLIVVDEAGHVTYCSPSTEQALGVEHNSADGTLFCELVHPEDRDGIERSLRGVEPGVSSPEVEARLRFASGEWRCVAVTITDLLTDPDVAGLVINAHDIDDLRRLASFDSLTGLANRSAFLDQLGTHLETDVELAVLLFDLDGFKEINDSLGHAAGDRVLSEVGRRLAAQTRRGDLVARLGGDEFAMVVVGSQVLLAALAERSLAAIAAPIVLDDLAVGVDVSIGVANRRPEHDDARQLLRDADLAMYAAKDAGKGRFVFYETTMGDRARRRLDLRSALHDALAGEQLTLNYQPTFSLLDGSLDGFEALLRWHHPTRGWIAPAEFIPAAEESNQIITIGRWVLDQAVRQLHEWQRMMPATAPALSMAVNLSPRQLVDPGLVTEVRRVIADAGVLTSAVILEITEGALVANPTSAAEVLARLKGIGIRLAIDDYGSGNASINYLRRFDVDILKIDRSLVDPLATDEGESRAIVRSIIELATALGLETVGEGIETVEQLGELRTMGCHIGQGYHLARPMAAEAATLFVQAAAREHVAPLVVG